MTTRAGVALVGCGAWGINHLRVWDRLDCLSVVCDPDEERLNLVNERYPRHDTTTSFEEVLTREDVAGVVLATPAAAHESMAIRAVAAGKDVLVEKPLALDALGGRRVVEAAEAADKILMVGHVLEYHPVITKLLELVTAGDLGRVRYVYSNRLNFGRIRTEENALWSFAPHDAAIMLRLTGSVPEEVSSHGAAYLTRAVADVTLTTLRFGPDLLGHIFVSWLHPFKDHKVVVVGESQMAVFNDMEPWPSKLQLYPHEVDWAGGRVPIARRSDAVPVPVPEVEPLEVECRHFVDCIATRERPLTDGESAIRVLEILDAAQRSLDRGGQPIILSRRFDDVFVHDSAVLDRGAVIGDGTKIWHGTHVMSEAVIGRNCTLGQNVFVGRSVRIGNGVKIQNNVSVFEGVELEDHVFCGPQMTFTNVLNPRSEIERKDAFMRTLVREGATLGASCTIVCGTTIGTYAFVAAGAVVTRSVPDYALVMGVPARIVGWMCRCGTRLTDDGHKRLVCANCDRSYISVAEDQIKAEVE